MHELLFQSLGNHEFDEQASGLTPFIENVNCPVLASNLILTKVPELAAQTNLKKSIVLEENDIKIGIIGYVTPDTKDSTMKNDVDFVDEIVAIQEEADKLRENGVKILIALGHSGYIKDQQIAKEIDGIDLVIGGHSHSFLWNGTAPDAEEPIGPYPTYIIQDSGKAVPVVQAYAYTKYLGKIHLIYNSDGDLVHVDGKPILLDKNIPQDFETEQLLERYRGEVQKVSEQVIGNTSVLLDGETCGKKECNLGNLIADAMVYYYAAHYRGEYWTDVPIGMIQAGGIRASIDHEITPANITKGDLLTVMPFKGPLATISVNGTVLLQMLEHSVSNFEEPRVRHFLQFSGLHVVYNLSNPEGKRVVSAEARCWACAVPQYLKVVPQDMYNIITPAIIAQGGDGYSMLRDLPIEIMDYNELACSVDYVRRISPVYPAIEGRITILKERKPKALRDSSCSATASAVVILGTLLFTFQFS